MASGHEKHRLRWKLYGFDKFILYHYDSIGDGNCLLHAVANALYSPYRSMSHKEKGVVAHQMRLEIGKYLFSVNPKTGKFHYESILCGQFSRLGKEMPEEFSCQAITDLFISTRSLGDEMISLLSHLYRRSIYILDANTSDVMAIWRQEDCNAIVLLNWPNHYEMVGLLDPSTGGMVTHFKPRRHFIRFLDARNLARKK